MGGGYGEDIEGIMVHDFTSRGSTVIIFKGGIVFLLNVIYLGGI